MGESRSEQECILLKHSGQFSVSVVAPTHSFHRFHGERIARIAKLSSRRYIYFNRRSGEIRINSSSRNEIYTRTMKLQFTVRIVRRNDLSTSFFSRFSLGISRSVNRPTSQLIGEERSRRGGEGERGSGPRRLAKTSESVTHRARNRSIITLRET